MNNNDWVPVESGQYPEDNENVQVTYIGYIDGRAPCAQDDDYVEIDDDDWYEDDYVLCDDDDSWDNDD